MKNKKLWQEIVNSLDREELDMIYSRIKELGLEGSGGFFETDTHIFLPDFVADQIFYDCYGWHNVPKKHLQMYLKDKGAFKEYIKDYYEKQK